MVWVSVAVLTLILALVVLNRWGAGRERKAKAGTNTALRAKMVRIGAQVIRCQCGDPGSHVGEVCSMGVREPHKYVAYYHENWFRRAVWKIGWRH